jgi:hypothetical protein
VSSQPAEPREGTLARFDSVLRALVTFGLVEPEPNGRSNHNGSSNGGAEEPRWRLIPAVQRRLESLVAPAPPADKLVYFGHRCASCGEHGPTRMHSGVLLCDDCRVETTKAEPSPRRRSQR